MTTIIPEPSQIKNDPGPSSRWRGTRSPRIVGSLGIYTKIDFENREVVERHSTRRSSAATAVLKGKDPATRIFITSRICGICGDNHATCSVLHAEHGHAVLRHPTSGSG